jgi:hypothetical protein
MYDEMDDYGQFIEIDIIIDSNIKKNDDIILPKNIIFKKTKENPYIYIFIIGFCFIIVCVLFYNIYVSPPFK